MTAWDAIRAALRGEPIEAMDLVLRRGERTVGNRVDHALIERILRGIDVFEHPDDRDRFDRAWDHRPVSVAEATFYDGIAFTIWTDSRVMTFLPRGGLFAIEQVRRHPRRRLRRPSPDPKRSIRTIG